MKLIEKILIANRGEIALRIIRSARKLGIRTVALYAANEENAMHVQQADEAYSLGSGSLQETYLNSATILHIARLAHCDAIHPGYGFLSENPSFARACKEAGLNFVGPNPEAIHTMGNKVLSRELAVTAGIPVTRGLTGSPADILEKADTLPFPVLVKAAAGGGGKGMRIVHSPDELPAALEATAREAATYFGDGTVFLEQYILQPRHIEIQVLGDRHGNLVHLFERECSIQRRYQKIVEESPSPTLTPEVREKMGQAAVLLAKTIGYDNAGTVEFLVDPSLHFYFLEMNTRIQVEHPVTEMVTGIDLVEEQLRIASGHPLRFQQSDLKQHGHSIECRLYAEDPALGFLPSPGEITLYHEPRGKDIRVDSSIHQPGFIRSEYDPMISKLIVWGEDRDQAIQKMKHALSQYIIHGIRTNISYLSGIMEQVDYRNNSISTGFCDANTQNILDILTAEKQKTPNDIPALAALLFTLLPSGIPKTNSTWNTIGYWRLISDLVLSVDHHTLTVEILQHTGNSYQVLLNNSLFDICLLRNEKGKLTISINGGHHLAYVSQLRSGDIQISFAGHDFLCSRSDVLAQRDVYTPEQTAGSGKVVSMMPGKVVQVNVVNGQQVTKGDILLIVEAMKMENTILATMDGEVQQLTLKPGDAVEAQSELLKIVVPE